MFYWQTCAQKNKAREKVIKTKLYKIREQKNVIIFAKTSKKYNRSQQNMATLQCK